MGRGLLGLGQAEPARRQDLPRLSLRRGSLQPLPPARPDGTARPHVLPTLQAWTHVVFASDQKWEPGRFTERRRSHPRGDPRMRARRCCLLCTTEEATQGSSVGLGPCPSVGDRLSVAPARTARGHAAGQGRCGRRPAEGGPPHCTTAPRSGSPFPIAPQLGRSTWTLFLRPRWSGSVPQLSERSVLDTQGLLLPSLQAGPCARCSPFLSLALVLGSSWFQHGRPSSGAALWPHDGRFYVLTWVGHGAHLLV